MAELIIRVVDKVNPASVYRDVKCTKRGDVIAIQPDGWPWGSAELTDPAYRIVQVSGIDVEDLSAFLAPELDVDPGHPSRTLQRRGFKFDLDAFRATGTAALRAWLDDDRRASGTRRVTATLAQVLAFKVARPSVVDPG